MLIPPSAAAERSARALRATGLLDSPAERRFDRLTRLAAAALRVPTSLISLVDIDRQFFKSQVGLARPWVERRSTPISHAFCRHVVEGNVPLVVNNAREHPLVSNNPAIEEMGVAAYLGLPLTDRAGTPIGSLCVVDQTPRAWNETDLSILGDVAVLVQREINDHANADRLTAEAQTWRDIVNTMPHLVWVTDPDGMPAGFNAHWNRYTGTTEETASQDWTAACHDEDMRPAQDSWTRTRNAGLPWQATLRLRRYDGEYRLMRVDAAPLLREDGAIQFWVGTCTDIHDLNALRDEATAIKDQLAKMLVRSLSEQATYANKSRFNELRGLIATVREMAGTPGI